MIAVPFGLKEIKRNSLHSLMAMWLPWHFQVYVPTLHIYIVVSKYITKQISKAAYTL
jgi:hypothetical protein